MAAKAAGEGRSTGPEQGPSPTLALMPGTVTSCFLVTVITVLLALFSGHPRVDPVLRALFFALLFGAFHGIRRREKRLDSLPYRLVEMGFLVLTLGFSASAVMRLAVPEQQSHLVVLLVQSLERGAVFLLGVTMIAYGIILWIPDLLESYRVLRENYDRTKGKLLKVEHSHSRMEHRIVEADRYRSLGELAAGVAHDLRNPLTIVKAAAEALEHRQRSPSEIAEHTQVISRNIEKAERTISALLDLGKPRELATRVESLSAVVAEVVALVQLEARRRKVTMRQSRGDEFLVETDPKLLTQALLNLLLNALQASPQGAEVHTRIRRFCFFDQEFCALAVEDRGSGLSSATSEKLFSPFFTTKSEGTGLGLLSCRRILADLGGSVGLFPRLRGGARALILLPLKPAEVLI